MLPIINRGGGKIESDVNGKIEGGTGKMGGEEKRHQMMQNLFGDQSEEEEDEEEEEEVEEEDEEADVDSEHESNPHPPPHYLSDEAGGPGPEGEGEIDVEGHGEVDVESEGDVRDRGVEPEPDLIESEGERDQSSEEVIAGEREERERKESDSDEKEEYGQRMATSRRRDVIESGSERSEDHHYLDDEDEEVDQGKPPRKSPKEEDENQLPSSAPEMRDVFGDSDEEEEEGGYVVQNDADRDLSRSPLEDDVIYEKGSRPEDMIQDDEALYDSEEEHIDAKPKEKPVGPPLVLEVPLRPAPARPQKMNMIKVSNIMGIDPKPFDPKTYVEEDTFVTDESGTKKRIRLENNIVRWKSFRNRDGTTSYESNTRFVRWSDGSLQLLIGNEVLDISVQDAQHEQAHLFLRHGKGILQSQGRILKKMRFMPSSLSSNSHRLLTALVDSRHKKVYKVKNCITDIDPEREKEENEKAASQNIRANLLLNRKREKVNKKYTPAIDRRRQLSPGFLEDALDEEDEADYYDSRRPRHRFEEDLEMEARAERRIMNAKKGPKEVPRKFSTPSTNKTSRRPVEFSGSEQEESEYESYGEEEERSPVRRRADEPEDEYEEEEEVEEDNDGDAEVNEASEEEEPEDPKSRVRDHGSIYKRKGIESDEDSPPRKAPATHRRMAMVYDSDED